MWGTVLLSSGEAPHRSVQSPAAVTTASEPFLTVPLDVDLRDAVCRGSSFADQRSLRAEGGGRTLRFFPTRRTPKD